jgi:hypothetical protein
MALIKCRECGKEVSTEADKCPNCGARPKRKLGCLATGGLIFLGLVVLSGVFREVNRDSPRNSSSSQRPAYEHSTSAKKIYKAGDTVTVGYTSYAVWGARWKRRLSDNEYLDTRPDASFLLIDLTVRNDDKKPRTIPLFKLLDENDKEYETTSKAWAVDGSIGVLDSLNPGVSKQGSIVFDVPRDHIYKLKVSGGFWSTEDALIEISPK